MAVTQESSRGKQSLFAFEWARRPYEIRDGFLKPVAGGQVEAYDPLERFTGPDRFASDVRSLHIDLANLDTASEEEITRFASRWGLLGVGQHYTVDIRYFPDEDGRITVGTSPVPKAMAVVHAGPSHEDWYVPPPSKDDDGDIILQLLGEGVLVLNVDSNEDDHVLTASSPDVDLDAEFSRVRGQMSETWEWAIEGVGEVSLRHNHRQSQIPFEKHFPLFFPDTPPAKGYPPPRSDRVDFWDELCEPIFMFEREAERFQRVAQSMDEPRFAADQLGREIQVIKPTPRATPVDEDQASGLAWSWSCPSLLGAAYFMLYLEAVQTDRHMLRCAFPRCGNIFPTTSKTQKYCDRACQIADKQRLYRERKKNPEHKPDVDKQRYAQLGHKSRRSHVDQ